MNYNDLFMATITTQRQAIATNAENECMMLKVVKRWVRRELSGSPGKEPDWFDRNRRD